MKAVHYISDTHIPLETILSCCMCGNSAILLAYETLEPLCERCARNNNEARLKK